MNGKFSAWEELEKKVSEFGFDFWQLYSGEFDESDEVEIFGFKDFTEKEYGERPAQRVNAYRWLHNVEERVNFLCGEVIDLHNWDTRAEIVIKL